MNVPYFNYQLWARYRMRGDGKLIKGCGEFDLPHWSGLPLVPWLRRQWNVLYKLGSRGNMCFITLGLHCCGTGKRFDRKYYRLAMWMPQVDQ